MRKSFTALLGKQEFKGFERRLIIHGILNEDTCNLQLTESVSHPCETPPLEEYKKKMFQASFKPMPAENATY